MQNPLQIPYHFSYLASMFDFSLVAHQNQMMSNNNNNNDTNSSGDGNGSVGGGGQCFTVGPSRSPDDPSQNFDAAAMSLLFPQTLLANRFCHISPHHEDPTSCKDKILKTKGVSSSSFMIDSLLGLDINNAAARAVIKSGMLPSHHHHHSHHLGGINGINLSTSISGNQWRGEQQHSNKHQETKKENRYHPYAHSASGGGGGSAGNTGQNQQGLSRVKNSSNSSSATDKTQDNSPQAVRRAAKAKRVRTIFTPEQLERLEAEFERQQYMVGPERLYLASSLHLTEAQVKVWRKNHLELQQQRLAAMRSQQGDLIEDDGSSDFGGSTSPTPTVASSCNTIKD